MSFVTQHKVHLLLFLATVLLSAGVFYASPHETHAAVPVYCPTICETWDVGLSGNNGTGMGIPFLDDVVGTQEGWFVKKEYSSLSSAISDPVGTLIDVAKSTFSYDSIAWFFREKLFTVLGRRQ